MQITRNNISETKVSLSVTLSEPELKLVKDQVVIRLGKTVKTPGFRAGKAPAAVVEKQLDASQLQSEVMQDAINQFYPMVADKEKLRTLGMPEVEIKKFVPYSTLEFTAVVSVMPKIVLGDYKKIKKTLPSISVTDTEVQTVLQDLQNRSATKKPSAKPAKVGDEVTVDFDGVDKEGKPVAGASGKDYQLVLGSKTFIPGFEEGLVGVKIGDKKELKLSFPKDYHAANLAGSNITFKTTVKAISELEVPKADDALAEKLGPFKKIEDLKKDIKTQLIQQKEREEANKLKDEIVEELVKKSKLTLPEMLIEDQLKSLEQDFNQNLTYRGITLKEYLEQEKFVSEDDWRTKELKPQAERRVGIGMVLAAVSEEAGLKVDQAEITERIAAYKQQYQQSAEQFDKPEMQREVASRILTEKTVEYLFDIATK